MRRQCPDLILKIETRDWDKAVSPDRFKHITLISRDSIDKKIADVRFI